jgi:hypothetical protein
VRDDLAAADARRYGSAFSSFSSRTQADASFVDSSAWGEVSKKPTEVMTPSPPLIS